MAGWAAQTSRQANASGISSSSYRVRGAAPAVWASAPVSTARSPHGTPPPPLGRIISPSPRWPSRTAGDQGRCFAAVGASVSWRRSLNSRHGPGVLSVNSSVASRPGAIGLVFVSERANSWKERSTRRFHGLWPGLAGSTEERLSRIGQARAELDVSELDICVGVDREVGHPRWRLGRRRVVDGEHDLGDVLR